MDLVDPSASRESAVEALCHCITMGYLDVIEPLLNTHFVETKLSDMTEQCVDILTKVVKSGSLELLLRFLGHVDETFLTKPITDKSIATKLLCIAVDAGNNDMVRALVERGGNPNGYMNGTTLLHSALARGHTAVARTLVEGGAQINSKDKRGESVLFPLIMSKCSDKGEAVAWLISVGVDPHSEGFSGKQAIHVAAAHSGEVVEQLVKVGSDINVCDIVQGDTPMHVACWRCCPETIKSLVQSGAKFNLPNKEGETPLTKLLKFATDFHSSHSQSRIKLARQLMRLGFKCNKNNKTDNGKCSKKRKPGRNKTMELYQRLLSEISIPSLQHLGRLAIRDSITSKSLNQAVKTLELPALLKEYVLFRNVYLTS